MDEGQGAGGRLPERAQRLGERRLQFVAAGEVPVAGHILRLIPQPFHRVEFRSVGRLRQQMNPRGQRRVTRPGMKARLIPDDEMLRLDVTVRELLAKPVA